MLSTIEDKSYFERENSYSFLSIEFLRYKLRKKFDEKKYSSLNSDILIVSS